MNAFFVDAVYNLGRAAELLEDKMSFPDIEDATIQFAFGVERVFKGILTDVNPLFLLEQPSFENAMVVLYRDRLIQKHRENADKEIKNSKKINSQVLPFKGSMLRAAKFSETTERNIGTLLKLSDYRGIIAHRTRDSMSHEDLKEFLLRVFFPVIDSLCSELRLPLNECMARREEHLRHLSQASTKQADFERSFEELLDVHREIWKEHSQDNAYVQSRKRQTNSELATDSNDGTFAEEYTCPACENSAILFIEADWDVEGSSGEGYCTGVYVSGLECRFCDLEVSDYEQFDYLNLNEFLGD